MSVRSSTFSRWLSQPQGLQNLIYRAALPARPPLLRRQVLPQASRTFTTATKSSSPIPRVRLFQYRPFQRQNKRFNSGTSSATSEAKKEAGSVAERLRKLTKEYGWAALGVYLGLSALDLPVCFVIVQLLGVDRVGHYERMVVDTVKSKFPSLWPQAAEKTPEEQDALVETPHEKASIWTQLALAYAIHKSVFIFVRVPLTAAVTPKVVKTLRGWGWNIGNKKPKSS